jgi:hypothetical protein
MRGPLIFLKLADFWEKPGARIVVVFEYAGEVEGGGRHEGA